MRHLIVDGNNCFIRCFAANPTLDANGVPVGGLVGFLNSLNKFCELTKPGKVVVVFDGEGGSQKRRKLFGEYKTGRKPIVLKHTYIDPKDSENNLQYQIKKVLEYLEDVPVSVLRIPNVEADDVIAYLNQHLEGQKVIVSADRDFYQLLSEETIIYNPGKKTFFTKKHLLEEYKIHPTNFALAKAIVGDASDNIKGVNGVGFKSVAKLFPNFAQKEKIDIKQVVEICEKNLGESAKYQTILNSQALLINNFDLIQLENPNMGIQNVERVKSILEKNLSFNSTSLRKKFLRDGITTIGQSFHVTFRQLLHTITATY